MSRRVLSAGEVVVDLVLTVDRLPQRGGDVVADSVATLPGGATNVMVAARRQGAPVTYAGLLGTGPAAELAQAALAAEGIDAPLPPRLGLDTATIVTLVEPDGERTFVTTLGAEADLTAADLDAVALRSDDVVHVSGYGLAYPRNGPALARWITTLPDTVTVLLDPGPLVGDVPPAVLEPVLARTDWITAAIAEAMTLAPGTDARALCAALSRLVQVGAVVREGERGATVCTGDGDPVEVAAFPVPALDRNGAGDAHTGTLAALLAADDDDLGRHRDRLLEAVERANAAAAITVTRRGPATAPNSREVDAFLATRRGS